jgi:uncharacterized protein (DUF1919 family)
MLTKYLFLFPGGSSDSQTFWSHHVFPVRFGFNFLSLSLLVGRFDETKGNRVSLFTSRYRCSGRYLLVKKNCLVAWSVQIKFDCLPTDKVVRYKNRPDLQYYKWVFFFTRQNWVNKNGKRKKSSSQPPSCGIIVLRTMSNNHRNQRHEIGEKKEYR